MQPRRALLHSDRIAHPKRHLALVTALEDEEQLDDALAGHLFCPREELSATATANPLRAETAHLAGDCFRDLGALRRHDPYRPYGGAVRLA